MFSNYLSSLINLLQFYIIVIFRFIKIVFKSNRATHLVYLNYDTEHLFDSSFLVVSYNFQNALYYKINNQNTLSDTPKVFNLSEISNPIEFVVYGFLEKKTYHLEFEPSLTLNSKSFNTSITNLKIELNNSSKLNLNIKTIQPTIKSPKIKSPKIILKNHKIKILTKSFNQKEFI